MYFIKKSHEKYKWNLWLGLVVSFLLASCSENDNSRTVETLTIAVVPQQSVAKQRSIYEPLVNHINKHTGITTTLLIPKSYAELLEWFVNKKIDMAMFGGVTYVKAHLKAQAYPLVMRDVDSHFKSVVLIQSKNSAKELKDLKDASFVFGSRLSTSGHFMPRYFFQSKNIIPETFFSEVNFSGAHDRTAEWVRDGKAEAGVLNSDIARKMYLDGRLDKEKIKVLWESPPFADYVWAIQSDISDKQKTLIRDAFLHMSQVLDDEDKKILGNLGAKYFIPASHDDFAELEKIILKMEEKK